MVYVLQEICRLGNQVFYFDNGKGVQENNLGFILFDYEAMQTGLNHEENAVCETRKCLNCVEE